MVEKIPDAWWSVELNDLYNALSTSTNGLTEDEALQRKRIFGPNVLAARKRFTLIGRFAAKLTNPLILLLLFAGGISAYLGQTSDFIIISVIIFISLTLDVYQEHDAVTAAEKLQKKVRLTASVVRDGVVGEKPFAALVPGDIVQLSVGDIVPADGRLITAADFLVDQSSLTGESYPQTKNSGARANRAAVSDRVNCVFMGANVIAGEATFLVLATGGSTELGKVAKALVNPRPQTEFEKGINDFGLLLAKTSLVVSVLVFISHLLLARDVFSSLLFVLALTVGFAPELLPVILTINLGKGALRMSKKGVIVKSLPSIENFGSMEILATDKTGTLTENKISLSACLSPNGKRDDRVFLYAYLNSKFQKGFKGPLEEALLSHDAPLIADYHYLSTIPFDFFRKRVSTLFTHDKKKLLIVKGAPEEILRLSASSVNNGQTNEMTQPLRDKIHAEFEKFSRKGFRSLAVGFKNIREDHVLSAHDERALTFLGFLTFEDPAKVTAIESIKLLVNSGIEVKVLTGDNALVTEKIVRDLHLPMKGILLGSELENLTVDELGRKALNTTIFARLNPSQKERTLTAMRKTGKVVGYLGDGINDAPSLRASDIGISVNNAADVAKESADIILLHKSLHVLYEGVIEGRKTYGNVMKYLNMGTSSNFGNMLSVAVVSLFLPFLPMLPVQILLNNLLYDVSQLLVAGDNVDEEYLIRPKKWDVKFIRKFMLNFGPINSLFDLVTFYLLLQFFHASVPMFRTGWFLENIITQTLIVFSIRTTIVPFFKSKPNGWFALGLFAIVALALVLPYGFWGPLFSLVKLPFNFYPVLILIVVCYFAMVEAVKAWFYDT